MFRIALSLAIFIFTGNCLAGELVRDAKIVEVASNATYHGDDFGVRVEGGSGPCTGWIFFPKAKALSPEPGTVSVETYNQWFSLAMMALATGKKVRIHNYSNDSCSEAELISIYN